MFHFNLQLLYDSEWANFVRKIETFYLWKTESKHLNTFILIDTMDTL